MKGFRYPSVEEIEAVGRAARQARAEEFGRIARAAYSGFKSLFARPHGNLKEPRHA